MGIAYASLSTQLPVILAGVSVNSQQVSGNGKLSQLLMGLALCDGSGHDHGRHGHGPPDPPPVGGVR